MSNIWVSGDYWLCALWVPYSYLDLPVGDIAGGVLGGAALFLLGTFFAIHVRRRKARDRGRHPRAMEPVGEPPSRQIALRLGTEHSHAGGPHNAQLMQDSAPANETLLSEIDTHPDYDTLVFQMRRLRGEIRALRANTSVAYDAPELAPAGAPSIYGGVEAELRRDIGILRAEWSRLQAETEGLRDPPPAYN